MVCDLFGAFLNSNYKVKEMSAVNPSFRPLRRPLRHLWYTGRYCIGSVLRPDYLNLEKSKIVLVISSGRWQSFSISLTSHLAIDVFFCVGQLHIHVPVYRHQITFVLVSPLQFHDDGLSSESIQKWLWINWHGSRHREEVYCIFVCWMQKINSIEVMLVVTTLWLVCTDVHANSIQRK